MTEPVFIALRPGIEAEVCIEIARRQEKGIAKYGTTVADNPLSLRQWLQHAFEETLDKAIYLKRAIAEIDAQDERDLDDMCRAGKSVLPEDAGSCGNVGREA
jgi:hypothetical protein